MLNSSVDFTLVFFLLVMFLLKKNLKKMTVKKYINGLHAGGRRLKFDVCCGSMSS